MDSHEVTTSDEGRWRDGRWPQAISSLANVQGHQPCAEKGVLDCKAAHDDSLTADLKGMKDKPDGSKLGAARPRGSP